MTDEAARDPRDLNHLRTARKLARRIAFGGGVRLGEVWHLRLAVALGIAAFAEWIQRGSKGDG